MKLSAPDFWWQVDPGFRSAILAPLGWAYGSITAKRMNTPPRAKAGVPVCCVGNFVVGGAGKTPCLQSIARLLQLEEYEPGFLLRGYHGAQVQSCLVHDDHNARDVGDEALLYTPLGPTVVGSDRVPGSEILTSLGVDIILMDDGFQNPSLHKDFSIIVVDAAVGWGNERCFPAGPLRAPLADQIGLADALIVIGEGPYLQKCIEMAADNDLILVRAHLQPTPESLQGRDENPVLAFSGIGRPQKFYDTLASADFNTVETMDFPDHHMFSNADATRILARCEQLGAVPMTTEKDYVRLLSAPDGSACQRLQRETKILRIEARFDKADTLMNPIRALIKTGK